MDAEIKDFLMSPAQFFSLPQVPRFSSQNAA